VVSASAETTVSATSHTLLDTSYPWARNPAAASSSGSTSMSAIINRMLAAQSTCELRGVDPVHSCVLEIVRHVELEESLTMQLVNVGFEVPDWFAN